MTSDSAAKMKLAVQKLNEGLEMCRHMDSPQTAEHETREYSDRASLYIREAGVIVHELFPNVDQMRYVLETLVPRNDWRIVEMEWNGIGDWLA